MEHATTNGEGGTTAVEGDMPEAGGSKSVPKKSFINGVGERVNFGHDWTPGQWNDYYHRKEQRINFPKGRR